MDKTGIIVVSICVLLLGWWFVEQNKMAKQQAEYARAHPTAVVTNTVTSTTTANMPPSSTPATPVAVSYTHLTLPTKRIV